MLTNVDVFLGVAMVMLAVSLLLTIVTQLVSSFVNLRGRALLRGLGELFETLKPGLPADLAHKILSNPLVSDGLWFDRLAPAITKVDLLKLVEGVTSHLALAADTAAQLQDIRTGIETWFDAAMGRVANRFAMQARIITVIGAVVAAFVLHLDSFALVSQLYRDSDLRAKMASAADGLAARGEQILVAPSVFDQVGAAFAKEKKIAPPTAPLQTRAQAEAWIRSQTEPAQVPVLLAAFDLRVQDALGSTAGQRRPSSWSPSPTIPGTTIRFGRSSASW
jgi:hypothetical protein